MYDGYMGVFTDKKMVLRSGGSGLLLKKSGGEHFGADELLYNKCRGEIDICFDSMQNLYVLCQNTFGTISIIKYSDNLWKKIDILTPKSPVYFYRVLKISCIKNTPHAFFSVKKDGAYILSRVGLDDLSSPAAIGLIKSPLDCFDVINLKSPKEPLCLCYVSYDGTLFLTFLSQEAHIHSVYPLFKSHDIADLQCIFKNGILHICFVSGMRIFYIKFNTEFKKSEFLLELDSCSEKTPPILCSDGKDVIIYNFKSDASTVFRISENKTIEKNILNDKIFFEKITKMKIVSNEGVTCLPCIFRNRKYEPLSETM